MPAAIWNSITPLGSSTNPDESPVTAKQRGEAAAALGTLMLPVLERGVPVLSKAIKSRNGMAPLEDQAEDMGFNRWQASRLRDWLRTEQGQAYLTRFEAARRIGPSGSYDFYDSHSGTRFKGGFPAFNAVVSVGIEPSGHHWLDIRAANEMAGFAETPAGYTWHHSQKYRRMELVHRETHERTRHTGGMAIWSKKVR